MLEAQIASWVNNFKPLPLLNPKIDKCIECGFCEVNCLTCGFTLSSRQRIVVQREVARLKALEKEGKPAGDVRKRLCLLQKQYRYPGNRTCAGDGLCAMSCPMEINTGDLTHTIRRTKHPQGSIGYAVGKRVAKHFSTVKGLLRAALTSANAIHTVVGSKIMCFLANAMHRFLYLPLWTPAMPKSLRLSSLRRLCPKKSGNKSGLLRSNRNDDDRKVVYFPSCINQTMGLDKASPEKLPLISEMIALFQKAGYEAIFPENMNSLCCGTIWDSKGMTDIADRKSAELEAALYKASENGKYPVLCDQSPCLYRMRHAIQKMKLYEPVEFISTFLLDRLEFVQTGMPVAIHITCSTRKMGLDTQMIKLAESCSTKVLLPEEVGCCGFAGDKGFTHPEVNAYALRKLRPQIEKAGITKGYSNSRTCEIGLTTNSGISYQSIVYLVNQHTKNKKY